MVFAKVYFEPRGPLTAFSENYRGSNFIFDGESISVRVFQVEQSSPRDTESEIFETSFVRKVVCFIQHTSRNRAHTRQKVDGKSRFQSARTALPQLAVTYFSSGNNLTTHCAVSSL
jgi:hypothetical protein